MGNEFAHPIPENYWSPGSHERICQCCQCGARVDGIKHVAHIFDNDSYKTYIFYHFSQSDSTTTLSAGASEKGLSAGASVSIKAGSPLIKVLRKDGYQHCCVGCFARAFPGEFKSVALSLKGKAYFINSDFTLNPAAYGDF